MDDPEQVFLAFLNISDILLAQAFVLGDAFFYVIQTFALLLLLLLSGLVSGSEAAFFSLSAHELVVCRGSNMRCDRHAIHLLSTPQRLLATILILNNLANITFVTLATVIVWRLVGVQHLEGQIITLLTFISTILIVFFGEIVPKVYARQQPLLYVRFVASPLYYLNKLLLPATWIFSRIHMFLEKRVQHAGYDYSASSLRAALNLAKGDTMQKDMLTGLVNLTSTSAKEIMRNRHAITAVDIKERFNVVLETIRNSGFSRIPVYQDSLDAIKGVVYSKDLLPHLEKDNDFDWATLLRPAYFVPENRKLGALFKDFQQKRVHMAIIVNEYGGTLGLVTLEDIIEEIVGDIHDELDAKNEVQYKQLDQRTYVFEAKVSLGDFVKVLSLPEEFFAELEVEGRSLAGLVLELCGKLPQLGARVTFKNLTFIIAAVDKKRIQRVRVLVSALVY